MNQTEINNLEFAAFIGIDWADEKHDISLNVAGSTHAEPSQLTNRSEAISTWVAGLRQRFGGKPVAIALEQKRGGLIYALMPYEFLVLYPINPLALARYREAFATSRAKDDPVDADLLREMISLHRERFQPWIPEDPLTRQLIFLVESRRRLVQDKTRLTNRLTALLKQYFPQALDWAGDLDHHVAVDFLIRWPQLEELQKTPAGDILDFYKAHGCRLGDRFPARHAEIMAAKALTTDPAVIKASMAIVGVQLAPLRALLEGIETLDQEISACFAQHPDAPIFLSLPGAGAVLAPRLLAAFGTDRSHFPEAAEIQSFSGIAPVTRRSGKTKVVQRRMACPKFVRQSFHEFAKSSIHWSPWAKCYFRQQRDKGSKKHVAFRALAYKWIRVIHGCWMNKQEYDETRYTERLAERGSPLAKRLSAAASQAAPAS
ncbi:MAG: IS110 family transposase [Blastocatellia bacterium]